MPTAMTRRDKITLALLIAMSVFLFADQRIMGAILPELSKEYGVGKDILSYIGSAFTLVGAVVSIVFGFYTDKFSRKKLLIGAVVIGEVPCLLTGLPLFTPTLEAFVAMRILTGIGIGGIYPISFSLISDYFREEHRASASAWLGVAWAIGAMAGQLTAAYLTPAFGWRIAFILAAAPNFALAAIFAFYAGDPARGRSEEALEDLIQKGIAYKQRITLKDFAVIFSNKTNIFTFLQGIPGTIPWGLLGFFLMDYFETVHHASKAAAGNVFLVLGIGVVGGSVLWAAVGERLYRKRPLYMPILCGAGVLAGVVPSFVLMNLPVRTAPDITYLLLFYALAFLTGLLVSVPSSNVKAILMNVNRPENRGSVFAVFNITDNLGQGFGPAIGGLMMSGGYLFIMNFAIAWWIPCGLLFFLVAITIGKDRDALQRLMRERAAEMERREGGT
jgi:MFS family permease